MKKTEYQQDGLGGRDACCQAWWSEIEPRNPHRRREQTPASYPLASTHTPPIKKKVNFNLKKKRQIANEQMRLQLMLPEEWKWK